MQTKRIIEIYLEINIKIVALFKHFTVIKYFIYLLV